MILNGWSSNSITSPRADRVTAEYVPRTRLVRSSRISHSSVSDVPTAAFRLGDSRASRWGKSIPENRQDQPHTSAGLRPKRRIQRSRATIQSGFANPLAPVPSQWRLRDYSRHNNRKLNDVVAAVVERHLLVLPTAPKAVDSPDDQASVKPESSEEGL
jgi:hypothetical protein